MEININCDLGEKSKHHSDENDPKLLELFRNTTVMMGLVDVAKSKLEEVVYKSYQDVINKNPDIIFASWCGKKVNFDKATSSSFGSTIYPVSFSII